MNFKRKLMLIFLVGIMTFAMSACVSNQSPNDTPKDIVAVTTEKLKTVKSINSTMKSAVKMTTGEQGSEETSEVNMDIIYAPLSLKISGVSEELGQNPLEIKTYAQEENGELVSYEAYGNKWIKQNIDKESLMSSISRYDTQGNALLFLERATDVKEISRENKEINLELTIPEKDFQEVSERTQLFRMPGLSGLPVEYFKGIGDLKVSFIIDELTGLPKSYNMDLTSAAQTLMNNINHYLTGAAEDGAQSTVSTVIIDNFVINVIINSVDKTEKIVIPQEALDGAVDVAEQMKMNEESVLAADDSIAVPLEAEPASEAAVSQ